MAGNQLNGAYYGPSIPPQQNSYNRRNNDGCCCCCGLFKCCCGCIFNCILSFIYQILITIIIILAIVALLFWLIVRPNLLKFHVTDAALTQFNITNDNTLHYNLALNVTVRNPNRRIGIYYDKIEMLGFYKDVRFGSETLGTFFQHHKSTSVLSPIFKGQQLIPLGANLISDFEKEKRVGVYNIDVKVLLMVRFKLLGLFKIGKVKPKLRCDLWVPLKSHNGTESGNEFQATECDWDYKWIWFH